MKMPPFSSHVLIILIVLIILYLDDTAVTG